MIQPSGPPSDELLAAVDSSDPDRIATLVEETTRDLGVTSATVLVADYAETSLIPVAGPAGRPSEPVPLDPGAPLATGAGEAFLEQRVVEEHDAGSGPRLFAPICERGRAIGVLEVRVQRLDPALVEVVGNISRLLAHLVSTASRYTDALHVARRRRDLSLPAEMQWSLLPPTSFMTEGFGIGALLEPAYDVGGDAYDYAADGDVLQFALLDAMGHGLHASMISALAVGALRWSRRSGRTLVEQAVEIDRVVEDQLQGDGFVSGVLASLDRGSGELQWVTVAHEAPWVLDAGGARMLDVAPCLPMGMRVGGRGPEPVVQRTRLAPSSMAVLTSDGVPEARDLTGVALGEAPVLDLFQHLESAGGNPAYRAARSVIRTVTRHTGGHLADDATVVVVARLPGTGGEPGGS